MERILTRITNRVSTEPKRKINIMDTVDTKVEEMPKNREHFQLIGRYKEGCGDWFATGNLHKHKIDAEADNSFFKYEETKILRMILPI